MTTPSELEAAWTRADLEEMLRSRGRSIPRGANKNTLARMLATEDGHDSPYDCIDEGTLTQKTKRSTGEEVITGVAALECYICGRTFAQEYEYGELGELHPHEYESVERILASYGIR